MYNLTMEADLEYEWDEAKRRTNIAKHGVDFTAMESFRWDTAVESFDDRHGEPRWVAIGFIGLRLHVVAYAVESDSIRIISLRKAELREEGDYVQGIKQR